MNLNVTARITHASTQAEFGATVADARNGGMHYCLVRMA